MNKFKQRLPMNWPGYLPYPRPLGPVPGLVPNRNSIDWPLAQFAPPWLPPGSGSVPPYRYPKAEVLYSGVEGMSTHRMGIRPTALANGPHRPETFSNLVSMQGIRPISGSIVRRNPTTGQVEQVEASQVAQESLSADPQVAASAAAQEVVTAVAAPHTDCACGESYTDMAMAKWESLDTTGKVVVGAVAAFLGYKVYQRLA